MKKVYRIENLDCANCAAKLERKILEIDKVKSASISFMSQKFSLEADEGDFEEIIEKVKKVAKKVEPDCKILF